jgi:hypothetical protein
MPPLGKDVAVGHHLEQARRERERKIHSPMATLDLHVTVVEFEIIRITAICDAASHGVHWLRVESGRAK